mmetsp:Transcript_13664/g.29319  ORF Transcript_13664/g.29319 Transcript_13664/m.29319 type:complete len:342 (+) Transcript_13664:166-1191(+)
MSHDRYEQYKTRSKPDSLHQAAELGDLKVLQDHVKLGIHQGNPESVTLQEREDVLGMMPMHVACENGQLDVVEYLIKRRVDVDAGDFFRVTPLHLAAIEDHYQICEVLLNARANVKPEDVEGDVPLHWAATKGHSDVIELLVKHGSHVDAQNNSGWTALHRAVYNGKKAAVNMLVKLGASLATKTKDGNTPLHLACFMNHLTVIELLLSMGAQQEVLNDRKQTPLDLCITDAAREMLANFSKFKIDTPQAPPKPAVPPVVIPVVEEKKESEEHKATAEFAQLNLRRKAAEEDFPDLESPAMFKPSKAPEEGLLYRDTEFLQEASQAFEPLSGTASPYMRRA